MSSKVHTTMSMSAFVVFFFLLFTFLHDHHGNNVVIVLSLCYMPFSPLPCRWYLRPLPRCEVHRYILCISDIGNTNCWDATTTWEDPTNHSKTPETIPSPRPVALGTTRYVLAVVYRTVHPASSRVWRSSIPTAQRALVVPNGILRPSRRTHPVSNRLLSILIPMLAPAAYEQKRAQLWRKLFPSHHTPMAIGNPVY